MSLDDAVLCICENRQPIRVRDVDRVLRSRRSMYLVLRTLHKSRFGSILLAVEHATGKFMVSWLWAISGLICTLVQVLKQTVRAIFNASAQQFEDPWVHSFSRRQHTKLSLAVAHFFWSCVFVLTGRMQYSSTYCEVRWISRTHRAATGK